MHEEHQLIEYQIWLSANSQKRIKTAMKNDFLKFFFEFLNFLNLLVFWKVYFQLFFWEINQIFDKFRLDFLSLSQKWVNQVQTCRILSRVSRFWASWAEIFTEIWRLLKRFWRHHRPVPKRQKVIGCQITCNNWQ